MQQQTMVNDSGFLKYSWAHVAIFNTAAWWFLMQCHLRAQKSSTVNWAFLHCPTCIMPSLDSLNLFTIFCMILGFFDTSLMKFGTKWWAMIQLCFQRLKMLLLYPNMIPWPTTNWPAYCKLFQNSLMWIFYNLFTSFCLCPNFFEMCCSQAKVVNLLNSFTLVSENFGNLFFVLL